MTTRKTAGRPTSYDPDIPGKCVEILEARGMEITFVGVRDLMTAEFGVSPGRSESLERQIQSYLDQREADRNAARIVKLPPSVTHQIDQHATRSRRNSCAVPGFNTRRSKRKSGSRWMPLKLTSNRTGRSS